MIKINNGQKFIDVSILCLSILLLFLLCNIVVNNGLRTQRYLNEEPQYEFNFFMDEFYKGNLYSVIRECSYFLDTLDNKQRLSLNNVWAAKHSNDPSSPRMAVGHAVTTFLNNDVKGTKNILEKHIQKYGDDGYALPMYLFFMNEKEDIIPKYSQPQKIHTIYQRFIHGYIAHKNGDIPTALIDLMQIFAHNPLLILFFGAPLALLLGVILLILLTIRHALLGKLREFLSALKASSIPATILLDNILIVILLLSLSIFCFLLLASMQNTNGWYLSIFFLPADRYHDLVIPWYHGKALLSGVNPYVTAYSNYFNFSKFSINYLPGALLFSSFLSIMPKDVAITLLVFTTLIFWIVLMGFILRKIELSMPLSLIFIALAVLEYPVKYSIDRANLELIPLLIIALFFYSLARKKEIPSITLLSIASIFKPFPIFLIPLIWSRFGFRSLIKCLTFLLCLLSFTLLLLPGSFTSSFNGLVNNLMAFNNTYAMDTKFYSLNGNHSLYSILVFLLPNIANCAFYSLLAMSTTVLLYFIKVRKLSLINQSIFLLVAMILIPPVSFDYTLLYALIPTLILLLIAFVKSKERKALPLYHYFFLVLFILIITIKPGFVGTGIPFGPMINSISLLIILLSISFAEIDKGNKNLDQIVKYFSGGK